MKKDRFQKTQGKIKSWMYDHPIVKNGLDYFAGFIISTISAFLFAFGFNAFMNTGAVVVNAGGESVDRLASSGVSGISQNVVLFLQLCGWKSINTNLATSIIYFMINVPMIFLAFFGIGKRFTILTLINVVEASVFIELLNVENIEWMKMIAQYVSDNGGMIARVLFAGVLTGLSSALAFLGDFSAGGVDILAYYISRKRDINVSIMMASINLVTIVLYPILVSALIGFKGEATAEAFARIFFSLLYIAIVTVSINLVNTRNRKFKAEIITENPEMGNVIIDSLPHAATMVKGVGVYTGKEKFVYTIVLSNYEIKQLIKIVNKHDSNSFIQISEVKSVRGKFHVKEVK